MAENFSKNLIQIESEATGGLKIHEEKRQLLLSNKKLYDEETHLLLCPQCSTYAVKYYSKVKGWICNCCDENVDVIKSVDLFNLNFTDIDKYKIYKYFGIEATMKLTGESEDEIQRFVGSHFEKCCISLGDNCLYYNHFKKIDIAKKMNIIDDFFEKSIRDCNSLRKEVNEFFVLVEDSKYILTEAQRRQLDNDHLYIKQAIETIIELIENYIIAVAKTDLKKGQKVNLEINENDLMADFDTEEGSESFCWTDGKKGEVVGVCALPSDSLNEVKQMFENFKSIFENTATPFSKIASAHLSHLEEKVIALITKNDWIFQNQLWKELHIGSRKCSRIIKSLIKKDLITKESAVSNGARTYRLSIKVFKRFL